jgi:hypothetical protein
MVFNPRGKVVDSESLLSPIPPPPLVPSPSPLCAIGGIVGIGIPCAC